MALQNFVHAVTTITHTWLNKIDVLFSTIFDEATTKAEARAALGVVGLTGNETVAGIKTFTSDQVINGIEIGRGGGSVASNTTFGNTALDSNTTGASNTAVCSAALTSNTTGNYNTAVGDSALLVNTTGASNTAVGVNALISNTTGANNVAIGYAALNDNTGNYNTALGPSALNANTTGSGNTAINPLNSAGTYAPVFNPTTENDRLCAGSTGVTNAYVQVAWTVVSDARDKRDIGNVPHGLDFVSQLKPISYRFKMSREDDTPNGPLRYGFLAQDITALEGTNGVIIDSEDTEKLRYNESAMVAVLVKAIQELRAEFYFYKTNHP